jgi:hypothetical protein
VSGISIPPSALPKATVTVEGNEVLCAVRGPLSAHEADMLADALRLGAQAARRAQANVDAAFRDFEAVTDHLSAGRNTEH